MRPLCEDTEYHRYLYRAGPHSAQGPLVTSVCLSKCPLQLRQGLTLQPRLSGSSSPDWPRTLEFFLHSLLLLRLWRLETPHLAPPSISNHHLSVSFFWHFLLTIFQPPVHLLFNFFLFRVSPSWLQPWGFSCFSLWSPRTAGMRLPPSWLPHSFSRCNKNYLSKM